ncbi:MAG: SGNH/GDSL hydrolase family protein [Bacilli bacterium]|nr:SGNH/GDSL hydrolase family protein [Bacilli bacterium]
MKKILLLILTLFLFLSCYLIYKYTEKEELNVLMIGDDLLYNSNFNDNYQNMSMNDYRIVDVINIIKYNQNIDNKNNIHQLLNNADILIISIGMNDLYFKLNNEISDVYSHLNKMVNDLEVLFDLINRYNYKEVIFLGYYNIFDDKDDYFSYINYRIKNICLNNNIEYIDLNSIFNHNFLIKKDYFLLNELGYNEIYKILVEKVRNC